ncbi:hypothetical protein NC653_005852 [Populus alba x Populus x berolinensis]|uniref:Zinc-ribbon 15 domain-containing protein n=1 Tax=Populus alba x Populus x berolinensis TaxID=444605 RepID=A0AAD6WCC9_9ROSI|nr:hypothetical protein NC653_005852 [Populus alba x Populus x berolinensis]
MAPSTIYQYHMRQDFSANVDSNNSTTPTTDAIIIHLQFRHVLELCYPETIQIPLNTTNESHLFPRQLFSSHVNRESIVKEILSSMGCSPDFIESAAPDISSFALDMVTNPCNASSSEVLTMVLAIHVTTPYDEREEIDRALSESLMQEASRFKPASKSCIDGLKRMSLEGSCSMKECMVCLEEFLMGSEGKPEDTLYNIRKTTEAATKESMIIRTIRVVPATKSLRIAGTLVALEKSLCPLNHLAICQIEFKEMRMFVLYVGGAGHIMETSEVHYRIAPADTTGVHVFDKDFMKISSDKEPRCYTEDGSLLKLNITITYGDGFGWPTFSCQCVALEDLGGLFSMCTAGTSTESRSPISGARPGKRSQCFAPFTAILPVAATDAAAAGSAAFLTGGVEQQVRQVLKSGAGRCIRCASKADLVEYEKVLKLFFIPVWKWPGKEPAMYCHNCNLIFPESFSRPPPKSDYSLPRSVVTESLRCHFCDRVVESEFKFCPFCGSSL